MSSKSKSKIEPVELMTPAEVAKVFRVDPKTVTRWANKGKLPFIKTLGGHRRFARADVMKAARKYRKAS